MPKIFQRDSAMQCEAILLGREQVEGGVDTTSLATLIRSLLPASGRKSWSNSADERYTLRCQDGLEFIKKIVQNKQHHHSKRHDDEGFESDGDDDSASTRSLGSSADDTISNSSSCCFVDDHVFKCHPTTPTPSGRSSSTARVPSSSTSSCVSSVATDSANSSGASDTEDTSAPPTPSPTVTTTSVSALVKSLSLFQQRNSSTLPSKQTSLSTVASNKDEHDYGRESYAVNEVAFCHTDPSFPRVVVWVVKKRRAQRLSPSGTDTSSGLEAVVFECSNEENMKKLCESFQETSRRAKLDQYRHPHRRKDTSPAPNRTQSSSITPESIIKALKDASEKNPTLSTTLNSTVKPIIKPKPIHLPTSRTSSSNSSGPGSEVEVLSTVAGTRFNLVQRTDGDGVTHIEVSRGLPMENPVENVISLEEDQDSCGPSSIISISTPDVGNLLNANGGKSKFCKEIEGVIRSDVDVGGAKKEAMQRQRQPAILVIHSGNGEDDSGELRKVWSPPQSATIPQVSSDVSENSQTEPPQRPERKKYTRKIKPPAPQPPSPNSQTIKIQNQPESNKKVSLSKTQIDVNTSVVPHKRVSNNTNNQQMVVRGQFIRVSVDQQPQVVPVIQQGGWIYGNAANAGNLVAYSPAPPNWGIPVTTTVMSVTNKNQTKNKPHPKSKESHEIFTTSTATQFQQQQQQQQTQHYQKNRSRSRNNINTRSKSPPARRPMAYRYIDTVPTSNTANTLSNRFFGLSQKLREIGGSVVNSTSNTPYNEPARRRNSIGELPARFEYFGESCGGGGSEGKNGNLKSVIKKNRRLGEYTEPKKVTFSAYATVQVVD
ncbi:hypothetical protein C0J52_23818 [Blattella germanica]|nr:hypothetical protein C0J52_23818 [Blattella germanica]